MRVFVFRQTRDDRADALYRETRRGNLRQGWSWDPQLDLRRGRASWLRAFERLADREKNVAPETAYRLLTRMFWIQPGDLIIVPNQPDDGSFLMVRAAAVSGASAEAPCYRFGKAVEGDFRSIVRVDPSTLREIHYSSVRGIRQASKRFLAYRSRVQQVREDTLIRRLEALASDSGTSMRRRKVGAARTTSSGARTGGHLRNFELLEDSDYTVTTRGGERVHTRRHESLVNDAAKWFEAQGVEVKSAFPKDLQIRSGGKTAIVEAKILKNKKRGPDFMIREAVGQLQWYRFEFGPKNATLCVLLDEQPPTELTRFLEDSLGICVCWGNGQRIRGGPRTRETMAWARL